MINALGNYIGSSEKIDPVVVSGYAQNVNIDPTYAYIYIYYTSNDSGSFNGTGSFTFDETKDVEYLIIGGGGSGVTLAGNTYAPGAQTGDYLGGAGGGSGYLISGSTTCNAKQTYVGIAGVGGRRTVSGSTTAGSGSMSFLTGSGIQLFASGGAAGLGFRTGDLDTIPVSGLNGGNTRKVINGVATNFTGGIGVQGQPFSTLSCNNGGGVGSFFAVWLPGGGAGTGGNGQAGTINSNASNFSVTASYAGGAGTLSTITGTSTYFAAGGSGGSYQNGTGSAGTNQFANGLQATWATASLSANGNTLPYDDGPDISGNGGGTLQNNGYNGEGGSGVVIVRYNRLQKQLI